MAERPVHTSFDLIRSLSPLIGFLTEDSADSRVIDGLVQVRDSTPSISVLCSVPQSYELVARRSVRRLEYRGPYPDIVHPIAGALHFTNLYPSDWYRESFFKALLRQFTDTPNARRTLTLTLQRIKGLSHTQITDIQASPKPS